MNLGQYYCERCNNRIHSVDEQFRMSIVPMGGNMYKLNMDLCAECASHIFSESVTKSDHKSRVM